MDSTGKESVWVKRRGAIGSGSSVAIHTDPDCQALERALSVQQTEREKLPDDWPECSLCGTDSTAVGGVEQGEDPQARRKKLQETDPDTIGQ